MKHNAKRNLRAWAEIDTSALDHNARAVRGCVPDAQIMAIVKADAYGHGTAFVIPVLEKHVAMFGVADVREAGDLETDKPVFLLSPCLPGERDGVIAGGFIPSISSYEEAEAYSNLLGPGQTLDVHLVLDTGMGRVGIWQDDAIEEFKRILSLDSLHVRAVASHLPSADEELDFTAEQIRHIGATLRKMEKMCPDLQIHHFLNSAGVINFPQFTGGMVRVGLMLYGVSPVASFQDRLRPVMRVCARVTLVRKLGAGRTISYGRTFTTDRPTVAATLAIGYADGYPRILSGSGACVLINGVRCPLLGRVTMDQIVVDVSDAGVVRTGDEAVIFGRQGGSEITASELAHQARSIPWEILTGIQQRVTRIAASGEPAG